jgi:hypothetical protein
MSKANPSEITDTIQMMLDAGFINGKSKVPTWHRVTGRVEGNPDGCILATSKGCEGCTYSDEDKIGLGNCELKTKVDFASFYESRKKHHNNIGAYGKTIFKSEEIDQLINNAFLKSSVKELEKAIKIYLENKEVYKEDAVIWNEEEYYDRAKSIIKNNSLNIQIER